MARAPDKSGPRKRVPRAERTEQIFSIAERRFAESGYYAVSMDAIAEEVGLSKQMVYNYVGSKEELYLACFGRARAHLERVIAGGATSVADPQEQLWFGFLAFFTFVEEHPDAWAILSEQASARGGPFALQITTGRAEIAQLISGLLKNARAAAGKDPEAANTEVTASAIVGAADSLATWWVDHPEATKEYVVGRLMDVVWMGLGNLLEDRFWDHPLKPR